MEGVAKFNHIKITKNEVLTSLIFATSLAFSSSTDSNCFLFFSSSKAIFRRVSISTRSASSCLTPRPLLCNISSNFFMLSSLAARVCFCVAIRISISSTVLRRIRISLPCLSCSCFMLSISCSLREWLLTDWRAWSSCNWNSLPRELCLWKDKRELKKIKITNEWIKQNKQKKTF